MPRSFGPCEFVLFRYLGLTTCTVFSSKVPVTPSYHLIIIGGADGNTFVKAVLRFGDTV